MAWRHRSFAGRRPGRVVSSCARVGGPVASRSRVRRVTDGSEPYHYIHRGGLERDVAAEAKRLPPGLTIDVGCGERPFERVLPPPYIGIDYTTADAHPDCRASADALPMRTGRASVVVSTQYLEHADDPALVLREARRVLRGGGVLLLSTHGVFPHHGHPRGYWRWTEEGLRRQIAAAGFSVERIHRQGDLVGRTAACRLSAEL